MRAAGEAVPGLDDEVVRRWESGDRTPEPRYRKHLVLVFGMAADELGLLSPGELALRPASPATPHGIMRDDFVETVVRKVTSMLFGAEGEFGRKLFLKGLLGVGVTPLLAHGMPLPDDVNALAGPQRTKLDRHAVDAYRAITASHRDLYWTSPAGDLLPSVIAQARLGESMMKGAFATDALLPLLGAAVAEGALLAARLAFFDLAQDDLAEAFFQLAQEAAEVSRDHSMAVAVLAHRAFVPGFTQREQPARVFLEAAHGHARYDAGPLLRSWLHCVDGEISARTGQIQASVARIRSAEDALGTGGTDPVRLDFFDASRLAGFAGNTLLLAGRHHAAADRLREALDGLAVGAERQRAVLLFDLAAAQAPGDADQAFATAGQACDVLGRAYYATALKRVPAVRQSLRHTPYAVELDERVRALTTV
ncbi:hypothetical protein AB0K14_40625 [Actinosynnema sp. NPDC050801]|uniref:hypothetical protein n=1 Tax=unclassified Actinosynnema TaxID=2637065 RepID=UPI0034039DD7